ncbi:SEC-C domain-containing protein [Paenibacillus sp. FSL M7-0896]|uniref:YecA family protein n=1 Tax=Paenibacillus sp. FSL M7-0896 TaxID=2921610 RepID=UPI0030D8DFAC
MESSLIWEHFYELSDDFPDLILTPEENKFFIRGNIHFRAQYSGHESIEDIFHIEIEIPETYPSVPPVARDLGERIPQSFHTFVDGSFCLGAPLAVKMTFANNPTLLGFVNSLLIPYLYTFSFKITHQGNLPYGELSHGGSGLMNYYMGLFETSQPVAVLNFLKILAFRKYRGHIPCPCGSGNKLRSCHGSSLLEIQGYQTPEEFQSDLIDCHLFYKNHIKERRFHV